MKVICYLFISLLLLNSCTKNSNSSTYNFSGVVIDYSTGQRVGNTKVTVLFSDNIVDSSTDFSSSTITDVNGNYNLSMENNPVRYGYRLKSEKNGYSQVAWRCESQGSRLGVRTLNMSLNPYFDTIFVDKATIVNLNISNVSPSNINDTLELSFIRAKSCSIGGTGSIIDYRYKNLKLTGLINNNVFSDTFSLKGTPITSVEWKVKNNGVISTGSQNLSPTEFGVSNYNINY